MMKSGEESLLLMGILVHIYVHSIPGSDFTLLHTRLRFPCGTQSNMTAGLQQQCAAGFVTEWQRTQWWACCVGQLHPKLLCCGHLTHTSAGCLLLTSKVFHWRFGNQAQATLSLCASLQIIICPRSFMHALLAKCIHRLNPSCLWSF